MILHKNVFVEITYEKEFSLVINKFFESTDDMSTDDFKKEMHIFAEICQKYKPEKELAHLRDMKYIIVPDVQLWMNEEIFPKYENIIKRMAFVIPSDVFAEVAVEQTMEEETGMKFDHEYFDNEDDARKWLMKD
jgi:hypothetical protein